jgi:hypothetical protein
VSTHRRFSEISCVTCTGQLSWQVQLRTPTPLLSCRLYQVPQDACKRYFNGLKLCCCTRVQLSDIRLQGCISSCRAQCTERAADNQPVQQSAARWDLQGICGCLKSCTTMPYMLTWQQMCVHKLSRINCHRQYLLLHAACHTHGTCRAQCTQHAADNQPAKQSYGKMALAG